MRALLSRRYATRRSLLISPALKRRATLMPTLRIEIKLNHYRICTSIVERSNLSIRTSVGRLTRLTNTLSRKFSSLAQRHLLS